MRRGGFDSESSSDEAEMAASKQSKEEAMHACELGVRFPLFVMTLRRPELHHRASAKRLRGKGHEGRQLFNVWLLRDVRSKAVEDQLFFFRQQNSLFRQLCCFFAKWGLFFASLYVHKSPAVLLNLGHPIAPLRFVCAI